MYNTSVIIVTRSGHPGFERSVLVEQGVNRWLIDPHMEVSLALLQGPQLPRAGCVVSFLNGLVAANHTVIVRERRKFTHCRDYQFKQANYFFDFHYFLFGLAWGRGKWNGVKNRLLTSIVHDQRLAVLIETGRYYFTHSWERPIVLQIPIE